MDTKQALRVDAYHRLADGETAATVSKELGLDYKVVCKLQRDLSIYTLNEVLASIDSDRELVEVLEAVKENTPPKLHKKIDTVAKGLTGLQLIQTGMQSDLQHAMKIGRTMMDKENLKPNEWLTLVNGMTKLYESIFNKGNGTQVNISQSNTAIQMKEQVAQGVSASFSNMAKNVFGVQPVIEGEIE